MHLHECKFKFLKKRCQQKWDNAYLIIKNAKASWALMRALDPGPWTLADIYWLCSCNSAPLRWQHCRIKGERGGGGNQGCTPFSGSKFFHFHAVFGKTFAK